ncbi:pseudouridine synthase [Winogradskyella sp.]|uniref:pseudouridine synthase n=1 Tax=Winogradskyella sp. TaxID=1883156 RepID=UPI003F6AF34D
MFYYMVVIEHIYYKIYKPYGYLSQFVNRQTKRKSKKLLGDLFQFEENMMAVGRLDEKSEGLLLITTDGKFSNYITSSKVEKEYHVMVDGVVTASHIDKLREGVEISVDGKPYITKAYDSMLLNDTSHIYDRFVRDERHGPTSWLSITIKEGKFRQVRKMTAKIGLPTLRLVRVRIGNYHLNDMEPGDKISINY